MPSLHTIAVFVLEVSRKWAASISDPKQFLSPLFQPTDGQIISGLEFYFAIVALSVLLYAPFVLGGSKGEFSDKAQLAASSFVNLFFGAALAISWHFAFWLFGGGASFAGTYLAYVHGGAPFIPLITLSALIMFGALPPDLRRYALQPAMARQAMQRGVADPRTSNAKIFLGSVLSFVLMGISLIMQFRCMSYAQGVSGWRLVAVVLVILPISAVVGLLFQAVQAVFQPEESELPAPRPAIQEPSRDSLSTTPTAPADAKVIDVNP